MNKKTKTFQKLILLFLVIAISLSIPQHEAHAGFLSYLGLGVKDIIEFILSILYAVILIIELFIILILNIGVGIASFFVDVFLRPEIYVGTPAVGLTPATPGVLTSNSVRLGWTVVRDVCNMFFMFFLLIVAFGTMLRSKTYNIKNILPKIIISLFLINFSMVAAYLVIDLSQFFVMEISGTWMGGGFTPIAKTLSSVAGSMEKDAGFYNTISVVHIEQVINALFAIVFTVCLMFIYAMLAIFLLIRLTAFAVLIIFSPVAFLGIAFPSLAQYSTQWWKEITKWAIFGPVFLFFIYLATTMANELIGTTYAELPSEFGYLSKVVSIMIPPLVPMVILLMAPKFASSTGMAGAGALVGGKLGLGNMKMGSYAAAKFGWGAGKVVKKEAEKRSARVRNLSEKGQTFVDKQKAKWLPAKKLQDDKKKDDEKKKFLVDIQANWGEFGKMEATTLDTQIGRSRAGVWQAPGGHTTSQLESAKLLNSIENDKFETESIPEADLQRLVTSAENDLSPKDFEEKILNRFLGASTMTADAQRKINAGDQTGMSDDMKAEFGTASPDRKKELVGEQIKIDKVLDMVSKGESLNKLTDKDPRAQQIIYKTLDSDGKKKYVSGLNKPDQKEFANNVGAMGLSGAEVNRLNTVVLAGGVAGDKAKKDLKKDQEIKIDAVDFGADLKTVFDNPNPIKMDIEIGKAFGKIDPKSVGKMSDADLEKYGKDASSSQIANVHKNGGDDKVGLIRNSMETDKGTKLTGATDTDYKKLNILLKMQKNEPDPVKKAKQGTEIDRLKAQTDIKVVLQIDKKIDNIDSRIAGDKI